MQTVTTPEMSLFTYLIPSLDICYNTCAEWCYTSTTHAGGSTKQCSNNNDCMGANRNPCIGTCSV